MTGDRARDIAFAIDEYDAAKMALIVNPTSKNLKRFVRADIHLRDLIARTYVPEEVKA